MPSPLGDLRMLGRSAGFVGWTFGLLACLEADLRTSLPTDEKPVTYKWMERYGEGLLRIFGLRVHADGPFLGEGLAYPCKDGEGRGRIFVMNHRSMLDIFVNLAFVQANSVSRADLAGWPVIGLAARKVGTLFVDRSSKESGAAVIHAMCKGVERGVGVLVYPEGTTFAGDEVRPFRPGAFVAAHRTGAEVVPLGIAYGGESASYVEEPFAAHYRRISGSKETAVALVAGEPIRGPHASLEGLRDEAHARVQALVHRARARLAEG
ncbi:MAG: lysophospholipid acyltransferase family protein [Byssovorax sp.]